MTTSVVIPNWQGEKLLEKNLPQVLKIGADEIIVVDDDSADRSINLIKEKFPKVKLLVNRKNLGFTGTVNRGVSAAEGEIIILLNTDVVPKEDLLKAVLPHFKDPEVFAVSFNEGKWSFARGVFYHGFIEHRPGEKSEVIKESFWASGGSAAFDKKKWIFLKGLDSIYSPFYWEDVDISYRAQMLGWKIIWEPKAQVIHEHEATIGKFFKGRKKFWVAERNQLIFFWKNISSPKFWMQHLIWLPARLLKPGYWVPFLWALSKLPLILRRQIANRSLRKVSDGEILAKFKD